MRYILYTDKFYDVGQIKQHTHIQFLNKLKRVPEWILTKPKPILVDTVKQEAVCGDLALQMFTAKKFKPLEDEV